MYLILLEKDGKEEAYSTLNFQPTAPILRERLQEIADEVKLPVRARTHDRVALVKTMKVKPTGE